MKPLGSYKNGNYSVCIFSDGTKIRQNDSDSFIPDKPESIDLKITNRCDMNCPMCHEDSTKDGAHADLSDVPFLDSLLPYTELAIGGGNPLEHPHLVDFLTKCKRKRLVANITVNQTHFAKSQDEIAWLVSRGLVNGVGVSVTKVNDELLHLLQSYENAVVHVINGVIPMEELKKLYGRNLKLLILGYKDFRRGEGAHTDVTDKRMAEMYDALPDLFRYFTTVSFDNLALRQLNVRRLVSDREWQSFYMGDDGQFTMYIDMVKREFAKSSISTERWPISGDIAEMFAVVNGRKLPA